MADWSEATKCGNFALRPTCVPKREHQEQKDLKRSLPHSGVERSECGFDEEISREPDHAASGWHQELNDVTTRRAL